MKSLIAKILLTILIISLIPMVLGAGEKLVAKEDLKEASGRSAEVADGKVVLKGEYEPLTVDEATDYLFKHVLLKSETIYFHDRLVNDIIELDYIQNVDPKIEYPLMAIILEKRDLHIKYESPMIINIGSLNYEIQMEDKEIKKFVPPS